MMTKKEQELLVRAGELLYGPTWHSDLARDLGVSRRSVQRWVTGERSPSGETWAQLALVVRQRFHDMTDLMIELAEQMEELAAREEK